MRVHPLQAGTKFAPVLAGGRLLPSPRFQRQSMAKVTSVTLQKPANRAGSIAEDFRISGPNIDLHVLPENLKKDCILFYCAESAPLAEKIASVSEGKVQLGDISWK